MYTYTIRIVAVDGTVATEYVVNEGQETIEETQLRANRVLQEIKADESTREAIMTRRLMPGI